MSETMRCDGCKHWAVEAQDYGDGALLAARLCSRAIEIWEATEWNDDYDRVAKKGFEDVKMFVADGSGYSARLLTRADFFCAHFEGSP